MDSFQSRFNETELNNGVVPAELKSYISNISNTLVYVSVGCVFLVGLGYLLIRRTRPQFDRLSLRLLVYTCFAHMCIGIAGVCRTLFAAQQEPLCQFLMFLYVFSDMFSTFLITSITVNLQVVFVHSVKPFKRLEYYYLLGSFCLAFILAIAPLLSPNPIYGYNENLRSCYYNSFGGPSPSLWPLMTLYLWILLATIYSIIAFFLILRKMHQAESLINEHLDIHTAHGLQRLKYFFVRPTFLQRQSLTDGGVNGDTKASRRNNDKSNDKAITEERVAGPSLIETVPQNRARTNMKHGKKKRQTSYVFKTISRVIWYPVLLILTRIWGISNYFYTWHTIQINAFLTLMAYIAVPLQGVFLFIFFICDPAFIGTIKGLYSKWHDKSVEPNQSGQEGLHEPLAESVAPVQSASPSIDLESHENYPSIPSMAESSSIPPSPHSPSLATGQSPSFSDHSIRVLSTHRRTPDQVHRSVNTDAQIRSGENSPA